MQFAPRIALLAFVVMACEGEQGPTGPTGNANVVTGTFIVDSLAWADTLWTYPIANGTVGRPARVFNQVVPGITSDIANNGTVFVYLHVPDGLTFDLVNWTPLPFHQAGLTNGYLVSWKYAYAAGKIQLAYMHESTDNTAAPPASGVTLPDYEFKYVAMSGVPASVVAALAKETDPQRVLAALGRLRAVQHP